MSKPKLIPTMPWHKRQCSEDYCIEWAYVLSTHDKMIGTQNLIPIYERTTKWKCGAGHRSDTKRLVDMEGKSSNE